MLPNSSRFSNQLNNSLVNDCTINPLMLDSPIVRDRVSRFSRFTESFNVSKLSHSIYGASQNSILNESSATVMNRNNSDLGNVSDICSVNLNISSMVQLATEGTNKNDEIDNEDIARFVIFESFFELNQRFVKAPEIFDLLEQFDETCEENMLASKQMLESKVRTDNEVSYLNKFSSLIRLERNSWRLLKVLYNDRLLNQIAQDKLNVDDGENMEIEEDIRLRLTDMELIERAFERNSLLREMQIVIDWLESVYDEESLDKIQFYSDGPMYWENTLHSLKIDTKNNIKGTSLSIGKGRQYCTEMDPDASIRTGMPLHDLDKEDENRLFHYIYRLIRSGHLAEGKEIAEKLGYYWLSAALDGWILHHNPNYKSEILDPTGEGNSISWPSRIPAGNGSSMGTTATIKHLQPITGNPYRDLWKLTSWKCSKMEGTNLYERAIFAVFSGNRSILIPLCSKWMDKLWAYFKCSLDVHIENLLIDSNIPKPDHQPRNNTELPDAYWDNKLSPEEIFHELSTQTGVNLTGYQTQLEENYHQEVQRCIILGKINELIDHMYEWSKTIQANRESRSKQFGKDQSNIGLFTSGLQSVNKAKDEEMSKIIEPNLLRFFAHMVVSLRNLQLILDQKQVELCVDILEIYIGFLIEYKLIELVAFYSLYLPEHRQVKMYATLLENIIDDSDRKICILVAKQMKLNLHAILTMVVENVRLGNYSYQTKMPKREIVNLEKSSVHQANQLMTTSVTEEDIRKISTLRWLTLDEDSPQYMELLWQGNAMVRSFLLERKLDQAKETFDLLPSDIVDRAFQDWKQAHSNDTNDQSSIASLDIDNVAREYFCNQTFFEANELFQKWNHYLYNSKPREPTKPKTMNRLSDRVAYEQAVKQYEQELESWHQQIQNQANLTSEKMISFLRFPEGIWINVDDLSLMKNFGDTDSDGCTSEATTNPKMETQIGQMIDDEVNSENEVNNINLVISAETNFMSKIQLERKQQDWTLRAAQLDGLRRIYVPQFVFLLFSVYVNSGRLSECLRIADIVANEQSRLYSTFTNDQIVDLLNKLREISIEILNQSSDPLGYSTN
ncbi:hypothetical protein BLOT_009182 [Blomia tropicalis]|nr:hypothetical protein BLOT_009182 [Blomia tropicalis]